MYVVRPFDPWRSPLCTCPAKYVLHPYTGCGHRCLYCYASSYIRNFFNPRPKKDLRSKLARDLQLISPGSIVEVSTSSDPYTPPEESLLITREAILEILKHGYKLLITTKSTLVLRDLDLLVKYKDRVAVAITITTLDNRIASALEPGAPGVTERLKVVKLLSKSRIPTLVRVDPIVPYINDDFTGIVKLVDHVAEAGAIQITSSTYKARPDSLKRLLKAFPEISSMLLEAYKTGNKVGGYMYLRSEDRLEYMKSVRDAAARAGLAFNTCREGFPELATKGFSCDGSSLIGRYRSVVKT